MASYTIWQEGGPDEGRPFGNAAITWDDDTRTVTDYRTGTPVDRPYTSEENTRADQAAAAAAEVAKHEAERAAVRKIITDLQAEKARAQTVLDATNPTINGSPASYVKNVARAAKKIADAAIDLARFTKDIR